MSEQVEKIPVTPFDSSTPFHTVPLRCVPFPPFSLPPLQIKLSKTSRRDGKPHWTTYKEAHACAQVHRFSILRQVREKVISFLSELHISQVAVISSCVHFPVSVTISMFLYG